MSKGYQYPILQNCRDIESNLKNPKNDDEGKTLEAAKYMIQELSEK